MKNLAKFLLFVVLLSLGISLLYDYQMKRGGLGLLARVTPEKYTLATEPLIDPKTVPALASLENDRRALVKSVIPSVVSLRTMRKVAVRRAYGLDPFEFFNRNPRQFRIPNEEAMVQNSLGSGVIVSEEGHIITNNHVVDQVDEIEVQLHDGRTKRARVVGADAQADLAVLKIDEPNVKPLKFGDSDLVETGDYVLAVGNPFGFDETVTDGIISSKGRPNRVDGFGDFLQTNAAINPGNSGGPLINLRGEIIGVNTAIISRSGGSQGIGFAIPSNTVKAALESLLKQGRIIRGYLGIQTNVTQQQQFDRGQGGEGVVVGDVVPGSPAAEAALQPGDIIVKFDGHEVKTFPELRSRVSQAELNKEIELEIMRGGKARTVKTTIREQPVDYLSAGRGPGPNQPPAAPGDEEEAEPAENALAGIKVIELTPQVARQLGVPSSIRGVVVASVDARAGLELRQGDVIEEINQQPVTGVDEFNQVVSGLEADRPIVLSVSRGRSRSFIVLRRR